MNIQNKLSLLILTIFLSGCYTERIDINLNDENKKVVIEAWITDLDQDQLVKLSYTVNYLDSNTKSQISDAVVTLSNNTTLYNLIERDKGSYYLPSDWNILYNEEYTLTVTVENKTYAAKTIMRPCPMIEDLHTITYENEEEEETIKATIFSFQETEGEGDGYFARDYKLGSLRKDSLSNGSFIDDAFYDGFYFEDIEITENSFEKGDTAVVELFSIGSDASLFLQDINDEKFRGGLFDAPPVNIRTNFSNGAVGFFIIGGAQRHTIIVE